MAARAPPPPTSDPVYIRGVEVCKALDKDATVQTVQELYNSLLHLATLKEWLIDIKTGRVSADVGYYQALKKKLGSESKSINIYGFTNKELSGTDTKVYTNLYPLSQDFNALQDAVYGPGGGDYIQKEATFMQNDARVYNIENWTLVGIQTIRLDEDSFSKARPRFGVPGPRPLRYRLTFAGPSGYPININFEGTDKLYFCKYETRKAMAKKQADPSLGVDPMRIYDTGYLAASQCSPAPPGKTWSKKEFTVKNLIKSINDELLTNPSTPWKKTSRMWSVSNAKDGKLVNYVFGYEHGIPVLIPKIPEDNRGLRLTEIEPINEDLWRLRFLMTNRSRFFNPPAIDVFVTQEDKVNMCV